MSTRVFIALGSNIGDRERALREAVRRLDSHDLRVTRSSSMYETEPMYNVEQESFLNAVVEGTTTIGALRLLRRLHAIEHSMGRRRTTPNAPRVIDLDLVLFGRKVFRVPDLVVPHPRMQERRFVLEPLAELAPDLRHPILHRTIREMLDALPHSGARKLAGKLM